MKRMPFISAITSCILVLTLGIAPAALAVSAGDYDSNFGSSGIATPSISATSQQAANYNGQFLVTGYTGTPPGINSTISMITAAGTANSTFGTNGTVEISLPGNNYDQRASKQGDNIIMAFSCPGQDMSTNTTLVRMNNEGVLDNTFGTDGKFIIQVTAYGLAVQDDGKILISQSGNLTRILADGSDYDTTFSDDGNAVVPVSDGSKVSYVYDIVVQDDDKILITGYNRSRHDDILTTAFLAKFNTDGSLDAGFGDSGIAISSPNFPMYVRTKDNGNLVWFGSAESNGTYITELTSDGSVNTDFGTAGEIIQRVVDYPATNTGQVLSDSSFVSIATYGSGMPWMPRSYFMTMYNSTGSVNTNYADNGIKYITSPIG